MARDFNRDWALRLCEAHIAIFPCNEKKRPLIDRWPEFSSCNPDVVAQWWAKHPGALPAIDLAKCDLFVLDGDRHGGPDGRAALRRLLLEEGFNRETAPAALTPADGVHVYFGQNGHELGNARGNLPAGIDARGYGGYTICPYAVLADGRRYQSVSGAPDLITAYRDGTIPHIPQGIVDLIEARKHESKQQTNSGAAGVREKAYAQAALEGAMAELAASPTSIDRYIPFVDGQCFRALASALSSARLTDEGRAGESPACSASDV
jgi:Bifunctional DNA primase/polymerase, N-terminal